MSDQHQRWDPHNDSPRPSADLEWRILTGPDESSALLHHRVTSPSRCLNIEEIRAEVSLGSAGDLGRLSADLFESLEKAQRKLSATGEPLSRDEVVEELEALGEDLAEKLVPNEIYRVFQEHWYAIESVHLVTEEVRIPWELTRLGPENEQDYLCHRFVTTRWLPIDYSASLDIRVRRILGLLAEEGSGEKQTLRNGAAELNALKIWANRDSASEIVLSNPASSEQTLCFLENTSWDLVHFAGHGDIDSKYFDRSTLIFNDGTISARQLKKKHLSRCKERRPLVFLNACRVGQGGRTLVGVGGWPDRWIGKGRCGALLCPQWAVSDQRASAFACRVYERLGAGETLARAVRETRRELMTDNPTDPTPLAYCLYAHTGTQVTLGSPKEGSTPIPFPLSENRLESSLLEELRALSDLAARDAAVVTYSDPSGREEGIFLDAHLYVERRVEGDIRKRLASSEHVSTLIEGQAGYGKTSLLMSLYRWFRETYPEREAWFLNAGRFNLLAGGGYVGISREDFLLAVKLCTETGNPPLLMIDTVDVQLHNSEHRDSFCSFLLTCIRQGARLVLTCRPVEGQHLPPLLRTRAPFKLRGYSDEELETAIKKHVARFYARSTIPAEQITAEAALIHHSAARGKPLKEVCAQPLTLRMLFELYAPDKIHELEINVCRLYSRFWEDRVVSDRRYGAADLDPARDVSRTASALGLLLLAEGRPEANRTLALRQLSRFAGLSEELKVLISRGVVRESSDGYIRFFHQTFFEHAAARGLVEWPAGSQALNWSFRVLKDCPGDAFLAPVVQEAMILGESCRREIRTPVISIAKEFAEDPNPFFFRMGFYVYAHIKEPSTGLRDAVHRRLFIKQKARDNITTVQKAWLDTAPNVESSRLDQVLEESGLLWELASWPTRQEIIRLLTRVAARRPRQVVSLVERWEVFDWVKESLGIYPVARELLGLATFLLDSFPSWGWEFLRNLYTAVLEGLGYRTIYHQPILRALAASPPLPDDGLGIADQFESLFPQLDLGESVGVRMAMDHSVLWVRQWRDEGLEASQLVAELLPAPDYLAGLPLFSRLSALSQLLERSDPEDLRETFAKLDQLQDPQILSYWLRYVIRPILASPGPGPSAARAGWVDLFEAANSNQDLATTSLLVSCFKDRSLPSDLLYELLSGIATRPEDWICAKCLQPVLGQALDAGVPAAEAAVRQWSDQFWDLSRESQGNLISALSYSGRGVEAFRLAIELKDRKRLTKVLEMETANAKFSLALSAEEKARLYNIIQSALDKGNRKLTERRSALLLWRQSVRVGIHELPNPQLVEEAATGAGDRRVAIAWLNLLRSIPAHVNPAQTITTLERIAASSSDLHVKEHARHSLVEIATSASDPGRWLETAVRVTVERPFSFNKKRLEWLSKSLNSLWNPQENGANGDSETAEKVLSVVDRVFEACMVGGIGKRPARDAGHTFGTLLHWAVRDAGREQVRRLVERCRTDRHELARVIIKAIYSQPDTTMWQMLDPLLEDAEVPEETQDLIRMHKHYSERFEGSDGYPELYELAKQCLKVPT